MKLLAMTDIHGGYDTAATIITNEPADIVILGGDLTNLGPVREVESALERFGEPQRRMYAIAGNMDMPQHDDAYRRIGISLDGRGVIQDGIGFFGVSAAPVSPLRTPYEITEKEIAQKIHAGFTAVKHCARKILISHAPPYGTKVDIIHSGYHVGSTAVREFIEEHQPDLVICGHIHEGRGQDAIERTKILNCGYGKNGCYAIIEIDDGINITEKNLRI